MRNFRALALCLAAIPASCRSGTNEPDDGYLVIEPDVLDFGAVTVSLAGRQTLRLKNTGRGNLTITGARPSSDLSPELRIEGVAASIAGRSMTQVGVVFTPLVRGSRDGRITFATGSHLTPQASVRVVAVANDPRLVATPEALDFGRVVVGRVSTASIAIQNASDLAITIGTVSPDVGTSNEFQTGIGGIQKLAPGESFILLVSFAPRTTGFHEGRIVVGDDTNAPVRLGIAIRGEGVSSELEIDPRALMFNGLLVGEAVTKPVRLHNLGSSRHTVNSLTLTSTTNDGFSLPGPVDTPFDLEPGEARNFDVMFTPRRAGHVASRVRIDSTALLGVAFVDLTGDAVSAAFGEIDVSPAVVSFGPTWIGSGGTRDVRISNLGRGELHLTAPIQIEPDGAPYAWSSPIPANATLFPHESRAGAIRLLPPAVGPMPPAALVVRSDDPMRSTIRVPIEGEGVADPVADLELLPMSAIDFVRVPRGVSASRSVILRNAGSRSLTIREITVAESASARFRAEILLPLPFTLLPMTFRKVQIGYGDPLGLAGPHEGLLRIGSDDPHGAAQELRLVAETVSPSPTPPNLSIELSWNTAQSDLDLHLIRPGGTYFSAFSDCCFCNANPMWDPTGAAAMRPFLDRDVIDGFGPEAIRLDQAQVGVYLVSVHYFADQGGGPTLAQVTLRSGNDELGTYSRMISGDQRWDVGVFTWGGVRGSFVPLLPPLEPTQPLAYCF